MRLQFYLHEPKFQLSTLPLTTYYTLQFQERIYRTVNRSADYTSTKESWNTIKLEFHVTLVQRDIHYAIQF